MAMRYMTMIVTARNVEQDGKQRPPYQILILSPSSRDYTSSKHLRRAVCKERISIVDNNHLESKT